MLVNVYPSSGSTFAGNGSIGLPWRATMPTVAPAGTVPLAIVVVATLPEQVVLVVVRLTLTGWPGSVVA